MQYLLKQSWRRRSSFAGRASLHFLSFASLNMFINTVIFSLVNSQALYTITLPCSLVVFSMWWGGLGQNSSQPTCDRYLNPQAILPVDTRKIKTINLVALLLMITLASSCSNVSLHVPCVLSIVTPPPTKVKNNKNGIEILKMDSMTLSSGCYLLGRLIILVSHSTCSFLFLSCTALNFLSSNSFLVWL